MQCSYSFIPFNAPRGFKREKNETNKKRVLAFLYYRPCWFYMLLCGCCYYYCCAAVSVNCVSFVVIHITIFQLIQLMSLFYYCSHYENNSQVGNMLLLPYFVFCVNCKISTFPVLATMCCLHNITTFCIKSVLFSLSACSSACSFLLLMHMKILGTWRKQ